MKRILFILFLIIPAISFATDKAYIVNVLIFSHITPETISAEQWPTIQTIVPASDTNMPARSPSQLTTFKKQIANNPQYQILFDGKWTMSWPNDTTIMTLPINNHANLTGNIQISLTHYFNVHTDLYLTEATSTLRHLERGDYFDRFNQSSFTFQLLQNRRMRSNELNYLERPLLGMLIKIVPAPNTNA
ncbi:MAG TPA: CsiV family protein [Coxiellaceae bacterium]|nr:CsiV family protein [Coxiellaceae bacterium]